MTNDGGNPGSQQGVTRPTSDQNVVVRTYRSATEYEHDAAEMAPKGWVPHGQLIGHGRINMGRTLPKGVRFLPWAIMRPSRQDEPVTVTSVRP